MKKAILTCMVVGICSYVSAQNVKIQTNKNKTQVKVKSTPAPVTNVQVKSNPCGTKIQVHSNPSGVKVKEHPVKGKNEGLDL